MKYRLEHIRLEVDSKTKGFLVLCDSFFPGWKVRVGGEEAEILRADFLFRAVSVPRGRSVVDFRYRPASYQVGKVVSLACLALILGVWIVSARFRPVSTSRMAIAAGLRDPVRRRKAAPASADEQAALRY